MTVATKTLLGRRTFLSAAGAVLAAPMLGTRAFAYNKPIELVHWSWLAASDGEVWAKMIDAFNEAHKDKGIQIRMELVPEEQYVTKVLAAVATLAAACATAQIGAKPVPDPTRTRRPVDPARRYAVPSGPSICT